MLLRAALGRAAAASAAAATAAFAGSAHRAGCSAADRETPEQPLKPADLPKSQSEAAGLFSPIINAYEYASQSVYDAVIKPYAEPSREKLLPSLPTHAVPKPTLVLSLDGCLIESQWTRQHGWRYIKRPGLDQFLESLYRFYEIVLWTEAMNTADPIVTSLDPRRRIQHRLYRDTTTFSKGHHRKDLSVLNRDVDRVVILDVSKEAFSFQPGNGILIPKYDHTKDPLKEDRELTKLIPFLQYCAIVNVQSFPAELAQYEGKDLADAFEKKLPELLASGKYRVARQRAVGGPDRPGGPTIWDRLRQRGS